MDESPELGLLFHRLNNQLGIILANAELLESRLIDTTQQARAGQRATLGGTPGGGVEAGSRHLRPRRRRRTG